MYSRGKYQTNSQKQNEVFSIISQLSESEHNKEVGCDSVSDPVPSAAAKTWFGGSQSEWVSETLAFTFCSFLLNYCCSISTKPNLISCFHFVLSIRGNRSSNLNEGCMVIYMYESRFTNKASIRRLLVKQTLFH